MMRATAAAPAHCRVTGLLSPEIAFEVSLPAKLASVGDKVMAKCDAIDGVKDA